MTRLATDLAAFFNALFRIDATGGPLPGPHNFWCGGPLDIYDAETRDAIVALIGEIDPGLAIEVWETALATHWEHDPVWFHGDIAVGNLIAQDGRLNTMIDFGTSGVGDPACDLAIAWTFFTGESREVFRWALPLDAGTWARGRAWTLWKALILTAGYADTNACESLTTLQIIEAVLADHRRHS